MNEKTKTKKITIDESMLTRIDDFILPNENSKQIHKIEFCSYSDLMFCVSSLINTSINALNLGVNYLDENQKNEIIYEVTNTLGIAKKLLPELEMEYIDYLTNR